MDWLARNADRRTDPELVLPGVQSVIVLAMNYFQGPPEGTPKQQGDIRTGSRATRGARITTT